jgi:hypothetical protein
MGEWLLFRRDGAIAAWHEVPGIAATQKSRPVGYGLMRAGDIRRTSSTENYPWMSG